MNTADRVRKLLAIAERANFDVRSYPGYAEPGYSGDCIVSANWNDKSQWIARQRRSVTLDDTPSRFARLFEKAGAEIEWCDEWTGCCECFRAVRTQPDSYCWTRSYIEGEYGVTCEECVEKNAPDYLAELEGKGRSAWTLDIDPESHGYGRLEQDFCHGFHPGQDSDPGLIADGLRACGIERFLFRIDSVGQFDADFSAYVHESEADLMPVSVESEGPSVSEGLKRALQNIPPRPEGNGVHVVSVDASTGTATGRLVSQQDFIDGRALDQ